MVELVDTLDLGSSAARHGGSSPSTRTKRIGLYMDLNSTEFTELFAKLSNAKTIDDLEKIIEAATDIEKKKEKDEKDHPCE